MKPLALATLALSSSASFAQHTNARQAIETRIGISLGPRTCEQVKVSFGVRLRSISPRYWVQHSRWLPQRSRSEARW